MSWPSINVSESSVDRCVETIRPSAWLAAGSIIFVLAVMVRLPSCTESFWLDELHSAWSVWGSLGEVASRAMAGNQTPFYFWGLWAWKQVMGDSELMLRLPSVLASATAAAVITIGLIKTRQNVLAGVIAGLVMAVESNSIFYGTELRPFSIVILLSAIACWIVSQSRYSMRDFRLHLTAALVAVALIATAMQPTSMGVFGWLVAARLMSDLQNATHRKSLSEVKLTSWICCAIVLTLVLSTVGWFSGSVLASAWQHRTQWNSVGQAITLLQLWRIWPWFGLIVLPFCLSLIVRFVIRLQAPHTKKHSHSHCESPRYLFVVIGVLVVCTFWVVAASGIAPVFHRRYFIACLPILAWACGDAIATTANAIRRTQCHAIAKRAFAIGLAILPLASIAFSQRNSNRLWSGDIVAVHRGEGWREAVDWLHEHHAMGKTVLLSPGLIETARMLSSLANATDVDPQWYLTYPLSGPYRWQNVKPISLATHPIRPNALLVVRGNRKMGEQVLLSVRPTNGMEGQIYSFGGVQVIDLSTEVLLGF